MQPLDRSVFGPMKRYYNAGCNGWMLMHPGRCITIYEVALLAGQAYRRATTPSNIISGFRVSGISPFDRNVFSDIEFLPSEVTDRPIELTVDNANEQAMPSIMVPSTSSSSNEASQHSQPSPVASGSSVNHTEVPHTSNVIDKTAPPTPAATPVGIEVVYSVPFDARLRLANR